VTAEVVFWFEFASTYSYPAAMRIEGLARAAGVGVAWRPFLLGPIFAAGGMADSPFNLHEAKGRYMWRDMERLTAAHGLAFRRPDPFPQSGLLAARVATLGAQEPWGPGFVRAVYEAEFAKGRQISEPAVISEALGAAGADPAPVLEAAAAPETKARLRAATEEAQARGIFGAPSFTVGDELFWGQDRLETAIGWAACRPA